jgi:hypothetical protein
MNGDRAMKVLRNLPGSANTPGTIIPFGLFDDVPDNSGFGIIHNGGVTVLYAATNIPGWPDVTLTTGLAVEVPDLGGVAVWVNSHNRDTPFGRYYWVSSPDRATAVFFEQTIWGGHFQAILEGPHGPGTFERQVGIVRALLNYSLDIGSTASAELIGAFGGMRFPLDGDGLASVFTIAAGL